MSNMSYCRFENTVKDIEDCLEHLDEGVAGMSSYEVRAYKEFLNLFINNAEACEITLEDMAEAIDLQIKEGG